MLIRRVAVCKLRMVVRAAPVAGGYAELKIDYVARRFCYCRLAARGERSCRNGHILYCGARRLRTVRVAGNIPDPIRHGLGRLRRRTEALRDNALHHGGLAEHFAHIQTELYLRDARDAEVGIRKPPDGRTRSCACERRIYRAVRTLHHHREPAGGVGVKPLAPVDDKLTV